MASTSMPECWKNFLSSLATAACHMPCTARPACHARAARTPRAAGSHRGDGVHAHGRAAVVLAVEGVDDLHRRTAPASRRLSAAQRRGLVRGARHAPRRGSRR
eukprot:scaffold659_cov329-Prasinococcus_capsulatus_cf.AAC.41